MKTLTTAACGNNSSQDQYFFVIIRRVEYELINKINVTHSFIRSTATGYEIQNTPYIVA